MTKRKGIIIGIMALVAGGILVTVFLSKDKREETNKDGNPLSIENIENTDKTPEKMKEFRGKVSFENMDGLFFFSPQEQEEFKALIGNWLYTEGITPKKIEVYEVIEELSQDSWKFYCLINDGAYKVQGIFKLDEDVKLAFTDSVPEKEKEESVSGKKPTEEEKALVNESYDPGYDNVDMGSVVITSGKEKLPKEVNQEELIEKMTEYLLNAQEYRREVVLEEVETDKNKIGLIFSFVIPRVDKKVFCVTVKDAEYQFFFGTRVKE